MHKNIVLAPVTAPNFLHCILVIYYKIDIQFLVQDSKHFRPIFSSFFSQEQYLEFKKKGIKD